MQQKHPRILNVQSKNKGDSIRQAAEALRNGALVIVPTDTVYGIAADPRVPGATERLCEAKGRDSDKPVPLLAASIADIEASGGTLGEIEKRLADKFWPGPLTLVLNTKTGTEGFRIPDYEIALMLLREVGGVLRVTSANLSGEQPALSVKDAITALGGFVDVAIDAGASPGGVPSTVAKVEQGRIKILREGAIRRNALEKECPIT